MDIVENFPDLFANIVVFESSLSEFVKEKRFNVSFCYSHIKLGEQKDPLHIPLWCVQLFLVQRYPLQPNVFPPYPIDSSYSYVEGSESSSSFSQRRFAHSATWYIQHVTKACEQTLLDRNASISILSDELLPDIPSNFTTLVPSSLCFIANTRSSPPSAPPSRFRPPWRAASPPKPLPKPRLSLSKSTKPASSRAF